MSASNIDIVAGIHTLGLPGGPTPGYQRRSIAADGLIVHEGYNCVPVVDNSEYKCDLADDNNITLFNNDIALLRLTSPVIPNNSGASSVGFIQPASSDQSNIIGSNATVTGWGKEVSIHL